MVFFNILSIILLSVVIVDPSTNNSTEEYYLKHLEKYDLYMEVFCSYSKSEFNTSAAKYYAIEENEMTFTNNITNYDKFIYNSKKNWTTVDMDDRNGFYSSYILNIMVKANRHISVLFYIYDNNENSETFLYTACLMFPWKTLCHIQRKMNNTEITDIDPYSIILFPCKYCRDHKSYKNLDKYPIYKNNVTTPLMI